MTGLEWQQRQTQLAGLVSQLLQSFADIDVAVERSCLLICELQRMLPVFFDEKTSKKLVKCWENYAAMAHLLCAKPFDRKQQRQCSAALTKLCGLLNAVSHNSDGELHFSLCMYHSTLSRCLQERHKRNWFEESFAFQQLCVISDSVGHLISDLAVNSSIDQLCH